MSAAPVTSCTFLAGMALPTLLFMTAPGNFTIKGASDADGWCPIDEMCAGQCRPMAWGFFPKQQILSHFGCHFPCQLFSICSNMQK